MGAYINRIEYFLPETILSNQDLVKEFPEWTADKIEEKVGIKQRHVVKSNETALDLAIEASKNVFNSYDKNNIDFVLLCTQSPDYFLPTSACLLQDKLGLRKNIGALDFNLGCSGYIYGLALAKGLINNNIAKNVLLVTAETYSKHLHKLDFGNRTIFGDAAAATIISKSENEQIHEFELGTDGSGKDNLIVKNKGMRNPYNPNEKDVKEKSGMIRNDNCLYMNGPDIFNFTIENIPPLVNTVLQKNNITIDQPDYFIFHQANKYMLDYLRKKVKIPVEKLEKLIFSSGHYKKKSRVLQSVSNELITRFNSKVPDKKDELLSIKGIGPKTANIVLAFAFNQQVLPIDTHCHRIPNRLGWLKTKTPEQTEKELEKILPKQYWADFNAIFVQFGRDICQPVSPKCSICPINKYCKRIGVTRSR